MKAIQRTLLVVVSAFAALLVLELGCRYAEARTEDCRFWFPERDGSMAMYRWMPSSEIRYELRPGFSYPEDRPKLRINEVGARGGPLRTETDRGPRIVVLGDSVAFGHDLDEQATFPEVLERGLEGRRVRGVSREGTSEVLNLSVPGYNTAQEAIAFEKVAARLRPDMVLLSYVMNDDSPAARVVLEPETRRVAWIFERTPQVPLVLPVPESWNAELLYRSAAWRRMARRYARHVAGTARTGSPLFDLTIETRNRALDRIVATARRFGSVPVAAMLPTLEPIEFEQAAAQQRVLEALRTRGFRTIDLVDAFQGDPMESFRHEPDDNIHPNAEGHRRIGEYLARELSETTH